MMKKIIPVLALAAAAAAGCADKNAFDVTIPVPEDYKGQTVILLSTTDLNDTLGLATAADSLVTISGTVEQPVLATVICNSIPLAQLVVEPGSITMTDDGLAAGTPMNDQYAALSNAASADNADVDALVLDFLKKNPANPYSLPLLMTHPYLADIALIDTIAANFPVMKNDPNTERMRANVMARTNTGKGSKFVDFTLTQPDGKDATLGQYVNGAKLTIVDFWASWCGPCRAEIPNLINLYKTYKDKGLQVVGVDVWERADADGAKAVEELGIPYPVMYGGNQDTTDLYGITGIPTILVIDAQGTIIARDIRGEELAEAVAAALK